MNASRVRILADAVLIAVILILSYVPAGAGERHFAVAAVALRIIAGIYALVVLLANTVLRNRSRLTLDLAFAACLGLMAWFETFPAGSHQREIVIYATAAMVVAVLGAFGMYTSRIPASAQR